MSLVPQLAPESGVPSAESTGLEGRNPSRFRGLCWDKKHQAWRVRIFYCGKQRHVGRYNDDVAAARAYDKAATHLYGAKAILNFTIAECMADPSEVSSFIKLTKQQAMQQQQQQHLYRQLPNPAASVATPAPVHDTLLLQCNVSSTGFHTEEDETYQQLSVLETQRALSPVHYTNNTMLGQQQQWALQQQLQIPAAGQQQSNNSGALLVWQQLQQHHMEQNQGLLHSNACSACWGYPAAAATVAPNVETGSMLLQGACDSSSGSDSAVLLQPSAPGAAPTGVGIVQQGGLLDALSVGSHGDGSLPPVQHACAVLNNNEPQMLLPLVQQSDDMLSSYSYGSINSCFGANVVHPICHHQLQQQAMFPAQQGQQCAVGNVAAGSNSCCNSTVHDPTTLLQRPYASAVRQQLLLQQQQRMTFAPGITTTAMACSGAPIFTLPEIHQVHSQLTPQIALVSSCNAVAMMAGLLQHCSISQRAAH